MLAVVEVRPTSYGAIVTLRVEGRVLLRLKGLEAERVAAAIPRLFEVERAGGEEGFAYVVKSSWRRVAAFMLAAKHSRGLVDVMVEALSHPLSEPLWRLLEAMLDVAIEESQFEKGGGGPLLDTRFAAVVATAARTAVDEYAKRILRIRR